MTELTRRTLGRTGLSVTTLGYGAMELRGAPSGPAVADATAEKMLNAVLDAGINFIDTSIDYGQSEELIGRFIAHRRREYFLAAVESRAVRLATGNELTTCCLEAACASVGKRHV